MNVTINGQARALELATAATLDQLVAALELKGDRIAVEHNGTIIPRTQWPTTAVAEADRFEIVHFVGGGCWAHGQSLRVARALREKRRGRFNCFA